MLKKNLFSFTIFIAGITLLILGAEIILRYPFKEKISVDGNEMIKLIDQQLQYGPRYMGSPGHKDLQNFLIAEMKKHTDNVITQSWDYVGTDGKSYQLSNIIGQLNPSRAKRIILTAHYDSKKLADKDLLFKDQPTPGADDNASGVAVLIQLARIISNSNLAPSVGLDIIFFDGEEGDLNQNSDYSNWVPLGSTYFAKNLNDIYGKNKPVSALVVDMVGGKNLKIYKESSSVKYAPNQLQMFWQVAQKIDKHVFINQIRYNILADHTPLNLVGIPSFLLIDFEYPFHHTTEDKLDNCSAKSLEIITRAIYKYIYSIN